MNYDKVRLKSKVADTLSKNLFWFLFNLRHGEKNTGTAAVAQSNQSPILTDSPLPPAASGSGSDLMDELLSPSRSDIKIQAGDEVFLCHKEVLSGRCLYFDAMFKRGWNEMMAERVILENIDPFAFAGLLCFIYGGSIEMPEFCSLAALAQVADMFLMEELQDAVQCHIATELCHSFHKPCKVCTNNFAEAIRLSMIFGQCNVLKDLYLWNSKYFSTLWYTNSFYALPSHVRRNCVSAVGDSLNITNVIAKLIQVEKFVYRITPVKWTIPIIANGVELMNRCLSFIVSNSHSLVKNKTFAALFEGLGFKSDIVDRVLMELTDGITFNNACDIYLSAVDLARMGRTNGWDERDVKLLNSLSYKAWSYLIANHFAVVHTSSWKNLSPYDRADIASKATCGADPHRKLARKPVLSSSLNMKEPEPAVLCRIPEKIKLRKARKYPPPPKSKKTVPRALVVMKKIDTLAKDQATKAKAGSTSVEHVADSSTKTRNLDKKDGPVSKVEATKVKTSYSAAESSLEVERSESKAQVPYKPENLVVNNAQALKLKTSLPVAEFQREPSPLDLKPEVQVADTPNISATNGDILDRKPSFSAIELLAELPIEGSKVEVQLVDITGDSTSGGKALVPKTGFCASEFVAESTLESSKLEGQVVNVPDDSVSSDKVMKLETSSISVTSVTRSFSGIRDLTTRTLNDNKAKAPNRRASVSTAHFVTGSSFEGVSDTSWYGEQTI